MALISSSTEGWTLLKTTQGPYHVEQVGPYRLPQVTGADGKVGISGPEGAVFQSSIDQANSLCAQANAGELTTKE